MKAIYLISFIMCSIGLANADICTICSCRRTTVDCSSRGLTSIPMDIPTGTRELNLNDNQITSFESSDFNSDLKFLMLDGNKIANNLKANNFETLGSLRYLGLRNNNISILPDGVFAGLEKMEVVRLENNKLQTFSALNMADLPDLEELYLGNNEISTLPHSVQYNTGVKVLNVNGNPGYPGTIFNTKRGERVD